VYSEAVIINDSVPLAAFGRFQRVLLSDVDAPLERTSGLPLWLGRITPGADRVVDFLDNAILIEPPCADEPPQPYPSVKD
jgi:hypothetical protein